MRDPKRRKGSTPGKLKHLLSCLATGACGGLVHVQPAQKARDELAVLKAKLTEATESFLKPVGGISAERLAQIEHQLKPMIEDAERRAVSRKAPMAMLALLDAAEFGEQKVRPEWHRLAVPAKRGILRLLFTRITFAKSSHVLSRHPTDKDRLVAATARTKVTWRKPGQPVMIPRTRSPNPTSGGARAQRRAKTSIELATDHSGTAIPTAEYPAA